MSPYTVIWTQLEPGTLCLERRVIELGPLRIGRRSYSLACRGEGTLVPKTVLFGILGDRRTTARWFGEFVSPDDVVATQSVVDVCTSGPSAFFTIGIDLELAESALADRPLLIRNSAGVHDLRQTLRNLFMREAAGCSGLGAPAADDVLRLVDAALKVRTQAAPASRTKHRHFSAVQMCQAYTLEHLAENVTLGDLAKVCGVSLRSLFNAFEAVTGLSPMAYLRAQRLSRVHDVLSNAPRGTRIIDVAADWGFWHMGHFAATYVAMFGETPSQTLKRRHRESYSE